MKRFSHAALFTVLTVSAMLACAIATTSRVHALEPVESSLASATPVPLDLADRCPTPGACTLYVATSGSNSNPGTQSKPFLTISKAASVAVAGSVICVGAGTYNEQVTSNTNGTAGHWISFLSTTPQGAHVVRPYGIRGSPGNQVRGFLINGNYTEVNGFEISGGDEGIYGDGTFKCATNNLVHNTGGDGIAMNCSDYSAIYGNTIHDCGKFATYCGSGISLYEAIASDSQAGFHNWVSHNISYDNNNIGVTGCHDGNGIIFDDWNNTQNGCAKNQPAYTPDGVVEENLAYGNGGVGIKPYQSSNITYRNNTAFENQAGGANGPSVPAEMANEGSTAEANIYANNIAVASQVIHSTADAIYDANGSATWDNNLTLCYDSSGDPIVGEFLRGRRRSAGGQQCMGRGPAVFCFGRLTTFTFSQGVRRWAQEPQPSAYPPPIWTEIRCLPRRSSERMRAKAPVVRPPALQRQLRRPLRPPPRLVRLRLLLRLQLAPQLQPNSDRHADSGRDGVCQSLFTEFWNKTTVGKPANPSQ